MPWILSPFWISRDVTYNSLSIIRVLGHDPEILRGQNAFSFIHPEDVQKAQAALQKAVMHPELAVTVNSDSSTWTVPGGIWRAWAAACCMTPEIAGGGELARHHGRAAGGEL